MPSWLSVFAGLRDWFLVTAPWFLQWRFLFCDALPVNKTVCFLLEVPFDMRKRKTLTLPE